MGPTSTFLCSEEGQEESADDDEREGPSEHNLAVEVVARAAVCAYEKAQGRVAEQMAQPILGTTSSAETR